jgi:hypothetical protein
MPSGDLRDVRDVSRLAFRREAVGDEHDDGRVTGWFGAHAFM